MLPLIEVDSVNRWFNVNLNAGADARAADCYEEVMDALLSEKNAVVAFSGHTGFKVEIENDPRTDAEVIASLKRRLRRFDKPENRL